MNASEVGTPEWLENHARQQSSAKVGSPEDWFHWYISMYEFNRGQHYYSSDSLDKSISDFLWQPSPIPRYPVITNNGTVNVYALSAIQEGYLRKWEQEGTLEDFVREFSVKGIKSVKPRYTFTEQIRQSRISHYAAWIATMLAVATTLSNVIN